MVAQGALKNISDQTQFFSVLLSAFKSITDNFRALQIREARLLYQIQITSELLNAEFGLGSFEVSNMIKFPGECL